MIGKDVLNDERGDDPNERDQDEKPEALLKTGQHVQVTGRPS